MDKVYYNLFVFIKKYRSRIWDESQVKYLTATMLAFVFFPYFMILGFVLGSLNQKLNINFNYLGLYYVLVGLYLVYIYTRYASELRVKKVYAKFDKSDQFEIGRSFAKIVVFFFFGMSLLILSFYLHVKYDFLS